MEYRGKTLAMHLPLLFSLGLVFVGCYPPSARADWVISGAQYSCSAPNETFELLPHEQSSADPPGGIPVQKGFKALPQGNSTLHCNLGNRTLQTQIRVVPPQASGPCMGGGAVAVKSMSVDGVELLDADLLFDFSCWNSDQESVDRIVIRAVPNGVSFLKCTIADGASQGSEKCTAKAVDVDQVLASRAKVEHHPADDATQQATSALKLPAADDLATVYPVGPRPENVPLCAHWADSFLQAATNPDKQWHARIAGVDGERVYIHSRAPQLCRNATDTGCTPTAYLLAGDRVDVGFLCGAWTYVQYERHVRNASNALGWVETARLYAVEKGSPKSTGAPADATIPVAAMSIDPLVRAAEANDTTKIAALVSSGESPDGTQKSGAPLAAAVAAEHLEAARVLLSLGASAKTHDASGTCRDLFSRSWTSFNYPGLENLELFALLVKAGADLNCRTGNWLTTPLMAVSGISRLEVWHMIQTQWRVGQRLKDPVAMAARLLADGADPNVTDLGGASALFYATEHNNIDVATILLQAGAKPNISTDTVDRRIGGGGGDQQGSTPLMRAYYWLPLTSDPTMMEQLLDHGADANYRNTTAYDSDCDTTTEGKCTYQGQTVLSRAAEDGNYLAVQVLLEHGADPGVTRSDGALPEDIARQNGHLEVAALIGRYLSKH